MIRKAEKRDRQAYLEMAHEFYHSPAVLHPVPDSYLEATFEECMRSDIYSVCYIMEVNGKYAGYALISKTFSQEVGGRVYWLEELYIRESYRSKGLGRAFFAMIEEEKNHGVKRFRLEVEEENHRAIALYERMGYKRLEYKQMIKDFDA